MTTDTNLNDTMLSGNDIRREEFDYTKWQADLFADLGVETLSQQAQNYADNK